MTDAAAQTLQRSRHRVRPQHAGRQMAGTWSRDFRSGLDVAPMVARLRELGRYPRSFVGLSQSRRSRQPHDERYGVVG